MVVQDYLIILKFDNSIIFELFINLKLNKIILTKHF